MQLEIAAGEKAEDRGDAPQALLAPHCVRILGQRHARDIDVDDKPPRLRHLELEAGAVAIEAALEREVGSWPPLLDQLPDITVRRRRWRRDAKRFTISGTQEVKIERG